MTTYTIHSAGTPARCYVAFSDWRYAGDAPAANSYALSCFLPGDHLAYFRAVAFGTPWAGDPGELAKIDRDTAAAWLAARDELIDLGVLKE